MYSVNRAKRECGVGAAQSTDKKSIGLHLIEPCQYQNLCLALQIKFRFDGLFRSACSVAHGSVLIC